MTYTLNYLNGIFVPNNGKRTYLCHTVTLNSMATDDLEMQ